MLTLLKQKTTFSLRGLADQGADTLVVVSGVCGLFIHVGFCVIFALLNLWPLVAVNMLSCIFWVYIVWLAANSRPGIAVHLATLEAVLHALLATLMLGPSFGFHFYLWPVTILIALNPTVKFLHSALVSVLTIMVFGGLSTFVDTDRTAAYSAQLVDGIFFLNILVSGFSMILTGMLVRHMFSMQSHVLREHARTDELTQLYNRRHILEFLQNTEANRRRNHIPYSVCLCDLDHFKSVNDLYGHDTGDTILINFADFLKKSVRKTDCVARWGGEEFLVVLTNTAGNDAVVTMNNLLTRLRSEHRIEINEDKQLSMSVGVAEAMGETSVDEIVIRADQALYRAKEEGRDRVVIHGTDPLSSLADVSAPASAAK